MSYAEKAKEAMGQAMPAKINKAGNVSFVGKTSLQVSETLGKYELAISKILPKSSQTTAKRMIQALSSLIVHKPDIAECTPRSIIGFALAAATLDLDIEPALGHIYPVPFTNRVTGRKEVVIIIGYKGMKQLALRSGAVAGIFSEIVFEGDMFKIVYGTDKKIMHEPMFEERTGKRIGAYVVVDLVNGGQIFKYMPMSEINARRKKSPSSKSNKSPWNGDDIDLNQMIKKTVFRGIFGDLPMSVNYQAIEKIDEKRIKGGEEIDDNEIKGFELENVEYEEVE